MKTSSHQIRPIEIVIAFLGALLVILHLSGCAAGSATGIAALASEATGLFGSKEPIELVHFDNSSKTVNNYYCRCKVCRPSPTPVPPRA